MVVSTMETTCQLDASSSGSQMLSVATRTIKLAKIVNVVSTYDADGEPEYQDIYTKVTEIISADLVKSNFDQKEIELLTREIIKHNIEIPAFYGSSLTLEFITNLELREHLDGFDYSKLNAYDIITYIVNWVYEAMVRSTNIFDINNVERDLCAYFGISYGTYVFDSEYIRKYARFAYYLVAYAKSKILSIEIFDCIDPMCCSGLHLMKFLVIHHCLMKYHKLSYLLH